MILEGVHGHPLLLLAKLFTSQNFLRFFVHSTRYLVAQNEFIKLLNHSLNVINFPMLILLTLILFRQSLHRGMAATRFATFLNACSAPPLL